MAYRDRFQNNNQSPLFLNNDCSLGTADDPETSSTSDTATEDFTSPSTASTSSVSSSPVSTSSPSSEQDSPHQPSSPPNHWHNFYGANLPPSPLHHYYSAIYPLPTPAPMAQARMPSRAPCDQPPSRAITRPLPVVDLTVPSPIGSHSTARPTTNTTGTSFSSSSQPARKRRRMAVQPTISLDDDEDETADDTDDEYDTPAVPVPVSTESFQPKKLAGMACIICMEDELVDLSVTPCGHMFCNKCLHGAIKATLSAPHKVHGKCPVCRGKVALKDVVVLEIKQRSKGKERAY